MRQYKIELVYGQDSETDDTGFFDIIALCVLCSHILLASAQAAILISNRREQIYKSASVSALCRSTLSGVLCSVCLCASNEHFRRFDKNVSMIFRLVFFFSLCFYVMNHLMRELEFAWVYTKYTRAWFRTFKIVSWTLFILVCSLSGVAIAPVDSLEKRTVIAMAEVFMTGIWLLTSLTVHKICDSMLCLGHQKLLTLAKVIFTSVFIYDFLWIFGLIGHEVARSIVLIFFCVSLSYEYYKYVASYVRESFECYSVMDRECRMALRTSKESVMHHANTCTNSKDFIMQNEDVFVDFLHYCSNREEFVTQIDSSLSRVKPRDWVRCYGLYIEYMNKMDNNQDEAELIHKTIMESFLGDTDSYIKFPVALKKSVDAMGAWLETKLLDIFGKEYFDRGFYEGPLWECCFIKAVRLREKTWEANKNVELKKASLFRMVHDESEVWNYLRMKRDAFLFKVSNRGGFESV